MPRRTPKTLQRHKTTAKHFCFNAKKNVSCTLSIWFDPKSMARITLYYCFCLHLRRSRCRFLGSGVLWGADTSKCMNTLHSLLQAPKWQLSALHFTSFSLTRGQLASGSRNSVGFKTHTHTHTHTRSAACERRELPKGCKGVDPGRTSGHSPPWSAQFLFPPPPSSRNRTGVHPSILLKEAPTCANADANASSGAAQKKAFPFSCFFLF